LTTAERQAAHHARAYAIAQRDAARDAGYSADVIAKWDALVAELTAKLDGAKTAPWVHAHTARRLRARANTAPAKITSMLARSRDLAGTLLARARQARREQRPSSRPAAAHGSRAPPAEARPSDDDDPDDLTLQAAA
jgi:hypothetical protein